MLGIAADDSEGEDVSASSTQLAQLSRVEPNAALGSERMDFWTGESAAEHSHIC